MRQYTLPNHLPPNYSHSKEILFIDATEMGFMKDRVHRDLAPEDIAKIKDTYRNWRKGENYQNEKGFCKSATLQEIQKHSHVLTPGRVFIFFHKANPILESCFSIS
jgi:type I restriction-modification system DNA methylase subunit